MLPIQSGYLSYQLAPRTQGQRAEQTEEVCRFDKLDKVQLLMIMEKLNDEDRVSFIMSCKKTYKVYKEAVVSNPELNPRILLMARRDRNVAHRAIDEFKKYSICQQAVFTATFGFADLAFCLVCSSTGCCCCTPSAAVTLGLQITSGVFCGLG